MYSHRRIFPTYVSSTATASANPTQTRNQIKPCAHSWVGAWRPGLALACDTCVSASTYNRATYSLLHTRVRAFFCCVYSNWLCNDLARNVRRRRQSGACVSISQYVGLLCECVLLLSLVENQSDTAIQSMANEITAITEWHTARNSTVTI